MHPIHSIMGNVLGMSVSTAVVICHTSVTVSVTGSNLGRENRVGVRSKLSAALIEAPIYDRPAEWDEGEGGCYTKLAYKHKSL